MKKWPRARCKVHKSDKDPRQKYTGSGYLGSVTIAPREWNMKQVEKKLQISIVTDIWQNKMMDQHVLLEENKLDHFEFRELIWTMILK